MIPASVSPLGALVALVVVSSCGGIFRSAGQNALQGARTELETPETNATIRRLADSSMASVDSAFRRDLAVSLETTWTGITSSADTTILGAEQALLRIEDSLAVAIQGQVSEALEALIRRNIAELGEGTRREIPVLTAELAAGLSRDLSPAIAGAIRDGTREFVAQLSDGVRTDLGEAMEEALVNAVQKAVRAGTEEGSPLLRNIAIGAGGFLLLLGCFWAYRDRKHHREALAAVAQAIDLRGDDRLKEQVRQFTAARDVEGWFRGFLDNRGLLLSDRDVV